MARLIKGGRQTFNKALLEEWELINETFGTTPRAKFGEELCEEWISVCQWLRNIMDERKKEYDNGRGNKFCKRS